MNFVWSTPGERKWVMRVFWFVVICVLASAIEASFLVRVLFAVVTFAIIYYFFFWKKGKP